MTENHLENQLRRLLTGLADQAIVRGERFYYDGGALHADDVAEIGLTSVLCLAQDVSERTGLGNFGYEFQLGGEPNPVFPLHAKVIREHPDFFRVAPFVSEVFYGEVLDCKPDLALLFAAAARQLQAGYDLKRQTGYTVTEPATAPQMTVPSSPGQGFTPGGQ